MKKQRSPAYQWYPRDFLADPLVVSMTLEQEGAYRRLLDYCWLEHGLTTEVELLWRIAKAPTKAAFVKRIWPVLSQKFTVRKGRYQHKRLDRERQKQSAWGDRASAGGDAKALRAKRMKKAREKGTHTELEWAEILIACGGTCARCGSSEHVGKDHIVPIYQGGSDAASNIQPLCGKCNRSKGADSTDFRESAKQRLSSGQAAKNSALQFAPSSPSTFAAAADQENSQIKSTGAARRAVEKPVENDAGTFALYCVIAKEALEESHRVDRDVSLSNVSEWMKTLCAKRRIAYDGEVVDKAIEAVLARAS